MPNNHCWSMIRVAALFTAGASLLLACGGSVDFRTGPDGTAGNAAGGAPSAGASSSGAGGGGAGIGGCANIACTAIGCGPGYKTALDPSGCCTTCVPDGTGGSDGGDPCAADECPKLLCDQGLMYAEVPGQCCGSCVPDPQACPRAQAEYRALRDQLLAAPVALSCSVDSDCQYLATNAACGDPCTSYAVSAKVAARLEQRLSDFAADNCSFCPIAEALCVTALAPVCANGRCILGGSA